MQTACFGRSSAAFVMFFPYFLCPAGVIPAKTEQDSLSSFIRLLLKGAFLQACHVAIVGAGPAGLIAADILSRQGCTVTVYDRMPSAGRKFLMAGRGGLNLTHDGSAAEFLAAYGPDADWLAPVLGRFGPEALREWARGLGVETFIGSSGRVFPVGMKAAPLLRALLRRLSGQEVVFRMHHDWRGWDTSGALLFATTNGLVTDRADATVLALGGASWPRLGSNGAWTDILAREGVQIAPFLPANCGFVVNWSVPFSAYAGEPLKNIALCCQGGRSRGEAVIAAYGLEGGAVYALSRPLREDILQKGAALLHIDLRPDQSVADIAARLASVRPGQSQAARLRKCLHLSPVMINLMREALVQQGGGVQLPGEPAALAALVKNVPLRLLAAAPLEKAISSAGGILRREVDATFQLNRLAGVWVAGEMLDWEAPTGGYLLTACFATGVAVAQAILQR